MDTAIVWFRDDLRLQWNPALKHAVEHSERVICLFILETETTEFALGEASRWWLHRALEDLQRQLYRLGAQLVLRQGDAEAVLADLIAESAANAVYWNRRYHPSGIRTDRRLKETLRQEGIQVASFKANLLVEPHEVTTQGGGPYRVFTPFWRTCSRRPQKADPPRLHTKALGNGNGPSRSTLASEELSSWELLPRISWDGGLKKQWKPTRRAGLGLLRRFVSEALASYPMDRDRPDREGTSRLSPYLRFGQVSPQEIAAALRGQLPADSANKYLSEIGWREFSYHLLYHYPTVTTRPLRPEFANFPWQRNKRLLRAWQKGQTGYPIVDAGMRQLWHTGWMHNRVRMIVASFLVKHLLQPWQDGAAWFWDTLVDADLANNTQGWQWAAGCGADAAPYFRIFNPVTQGKRFDPDGSYVKRWVPELSRVSIQYLHDPGQAPERELLAAGVHPGQQYPKPLVGLREGRERALLAYETMRNTREPEASATL